MAAAAVAERLVFKMLTAAFGVAAAAAGFIPAEHLPAAHPSTGATGGRQVQLEAVLLEPSPAVGVAERIPALLPVLAAQAKSS
jgi:hypothetical protein